MWVGEVTLVRGIEASARSTTFTLLLLFACLYVFGLVFAAVVQDSTVTAVRDVVFLWTNSGSRGRGVVFQPAW